MAVEIPELGGALLTWVGAVNAKFKELKNMISCVERDSKNLVLRMNDLQRQVNEIRERILTVEKRLKVGV